jgi:hypothetical protein
MSNPGNLQQSIGRKLEEYGKVTYRLTPSDQIPDLLKAAIDILSR